MPKDYFQIENCTAIDSLEPNARIHFIGVCGVAMGQLAATLASNGFRVSGSDKAFYEPMGSYLNNSNIKIFDSYSKNNITDEIDLVVIGNVISYGHEEVTEVEEKKINYTFFSQLLYEYLIKETTAVSVCGTHGKTTTTALITQLFINIDKKPSYFIGGVVPGLEKSLEKTDSEYSVVEGDEYDSSFFAKVPKFKFYHPKICIINAIEFDHADIYNSIDDIKKEFDDLIYSLPSDGVAIVCSDFTEVNNKVIEWKENAKCKVISFGENTNCDYIITDRKYINYNQIVSVNSENKKFKFTIPLIGLFNARNALAAFIALKNLNFDDDEIINSLPNIECVKRRQEIFLSNDTDVFIEDFAHHPTSVKEALKTVREVYPDHKIVALFEPASNTSRRKIFKNSYLESFSYADEVVLLRPAAKKSDDTVEQFSLDEFVESLINNGTKASFYKSSSDIISALTSLRDKEKTIFIMMSNSSFDGLKEKILSST